MAEPQRIQLSRQRGWRMPAGAIKVDRSTPWGNPYTTAGAIETGYADTGAEAQEVAVSWHRTWLFHLDPADRDTVRSGKRTFDRSWVTAHIGELAGKSLACWCPIGVQCHADLLLQLANDGERFNG